MAQRVCTLVLLFSEGLKLWTFRIVVYSSKTLIKQLATGFCNTRDTYLGLSVFSFTTFDNIFFAQNNYYQILR